MRNFGAFPEIHEPFDIKDGPDGWLWFTNKSGNSLGRIYSRSADASSSRS